MITKSEMQAYISGKLPQMDYYETMLVYAYLHGVLAEKMEAIDGV